jgi:hypothetical protein
VPVGAIILSSATGSAKNFRQNIFTDQQEVDLSDAVGESLAREVTIIKDPAVTSHLEERGEVNVYDLPGSKLLHSYKFPASVAYKKFSSDGKRLFVLTRDQTAYVLDLGSTIIPNDDVGFWERSQHSGQ